MTKTRDLANLGSGFLQTGTGAARRPTDSKLKDIVSVKDFGARGNGLGTTPSDEGIDISTATWNTWDGTPFKTNLAWSPYGASGSFVPPTAKPFQNTDTWDFIGVQLALWSASNSIYVPAGTYVINVSRTGGGLIIMKGQEQAIIGAGFYKSSFATKENAAFFASNNVGVVNAYALLRLYRTGGPPTLIADLGFSGPNSYGTTSNNLSLIHAQNINGVTFRDLWLTVGHRGISADTSSGDSHLKGTTAEFLWGGTVVTDVTSDLSIDFCNFWASANIPGQIGISAAGRCSVTNSRLIGFWGPAATINNGLFSNNLVTLSNVGSCSFFTNTIVSNNTFSGDSAGPLASVRTSSSVIGNIFKQTANHPCLNLGTGAAGSATNITVVGNTFVKTNNNVESQNFALIGEASGVGYFNALTNSCLISSNTFQGRANTTPGNATMIKNTFDGVLQGMINNETVTNNAAVTNSATALVTTLGDATGKAVMTGSVASGTTVDITGMLGIGQGGGRDQIRLNLVAVLADGNSFAGRAYALFTSKYNGNATLIATLGGQSDGGSVSFGTNAAYPTFTATVGAGGNAGYTVYAIPLI